MAWSDYWGALSARQRAGMTLAAVLILAATIGAGVWLLHDPYVPLASAVNGERSNELVQTLERAGLSYRISESADAVAVPQSQLGKARAAVAASPLAAPPDVGLELFKETDFSSTDFAQRINYQRALQGELARTIQTIDGVRSVRVHVILPEGGLFKRNVTKATAAVTVISQPGKSLTGAQVLGIQRLVVASVPEMKIDDVVVLDESGATLTRAARSADDEMPSAQLDLKRQVDQYLESKLMRLLQELAPAGTASLSVDATLDERQLRVTIEEPIATATAKNAEHATGVLVKERQSQSGPASGLTAADGYGADAQNIDREYEYKVGNRIEHALSAPGSVKRISVAVALQGAPPALSGADIEKLVAYAIGIDRTRGDSVAVLLLPGISADVPVEHVDKPAPVTSRPERERVTGGNETAASPAMPITLIVVLAVAIGALSWSWIRRRRAPAIDAVDEEIVLAKVRQWLREGAGRGTA